MNIDWQVKPLSRKSSISGESFKPGSKVICYIYSKPDLPDILERTDILAEESHNFKSPDNLLASWTRVVKEHENEEQKLLEKQTLENAEDFFLSLFHESADDTEETKKNRHILKQLLGLMLERKRVLRRLKNKNKEIILYLHIPSKKEYEVSHIILDLEGITKIQDQLGVLIL